MVDQVILWIDRSISDSLFFFLLSLSLSLSLSSCCDAWLEKKFVVLNLFFAGLLYWHLLPRSPQYFHWQFWLSTSAASFHQGIACRWCMFCSFLLLWDQFRSIDLCLHGQHMHTNSHICSLISICSDIYMYMDICRDRAQFSEKNCLFLMKAKFVLL